MASVLPLVLCIIATCTSVYGHIAGVEREQKCSPFDYDKKTLENMVRMEHAMELMNAKVDNNLKALREELEEFDSMKLQLNEQLENNQKTVELMKEDLEKYKQNNQKSFMEEFDSMKLQLNEQLENNQKTVELMKEDLGGKLLYLSLCNLLHNGEARTRKKLRTPKGDFLIKQ